jgi:hypothetical protein
VIVVVPESAAMVVVARRRRGMRVAWRRIANLAARAGMGTPAAIAPRFLGIIITRRRFETVGLALRPAAGRERREDQNRR